MPLNSLIVAFQARVDGGFRTISYFVSARPVTVIIATIIITILLGTGVVRFREINDVMGQFGADNVPSRYEFAVAKEFFQQHGGIFHLVVAMQADDGGNLLRPRYIDKALALETHLRSGLTIEHDGRQWAYSDFCGVQCENTGAGADVVQIFLTLYKSAQQRPGSNFGARLTFPSVDMFGTHIYLANNFFRVQLNNRSNFVEGAGLIVNYFSAFYSNETMLAIAKKWEMAVFKLALETRNRSLVRLYVTSDGLASEEARQISIEAVPLIPFCALSLALFTVITSLTNDYATSKGLTALVGLCCPAFSIIASFGTLFWAGFGLLPVLVVVPFLIFAVGVDDVFIMLQCWAHTDPARPLEQRLAEMLAHAGPSMGITSLTNWISFTIGILTPVPAIRLFCIFTSMAVFFAYLFQIFFYTAVMTISGRNEIKLRQKQLESKNIGGGGGMTFTSRIITSLPSIDQFGQIFSSSTSFLDFYVDLLLKWRTKAILALLMLGYWALSIYGIFQLKVGLTTEKLFHKDSMLLALYNLQTEVVFREGIQMGIFVNAPGDLRRPTAIFELMEAVGQFEHLPNNLGPTSTYLWLRPYLSFIAFKNESAFSYRYIPEFMSSHEYRRWRHFVSLNPDVDCENDRPECVRKFFVTTSFKGAVSWGEKLELMKQWRVLAGHYAKYNITVYERDGLFADLLLSLPPITAQTVGLALFSMCIVLAMFTPSTRVILTGSAAVLSINIGVFGFLHLWSIDLDPISMMTTLMAIGLSIDFVAHISFHYHRQHSATIPSGNNDSTQSPRQCLRAALHSIAWPMIQAGLSSIVCVLVLAVIDVYIVRVFVKVVVLVVTFGLAHGLIVLPAIYSALPSRPNRDQQIEQRRPRQPQICHKISIRIVPQGQQTTRSTGC